MRTFVTGGTGFIGGTLIRCLLTAGHEVRALVRRGSDARQIDDLPVDRVEGDLRDLKSLEKGMTGCDWVFHVAALYSFWGYRWEDFNQVNVEGTRRVMEASRKAGIQRVVHTSSIAVLGTLNDRSPANERTPSSLQDRIGLYQRSKFMAEEIVHDFVRQGLPAVIVNPCAPIGAGDHKPTPTGQIIVDYLNGRMFGYVDTGLNLVDVEDVAAGHLLAAGRGKVGERYILGGENLTLKQVLDLLAEVSGKPQVRLRVPHGVAQAWSYVDVALAGLLPGRVPAATPEKVRLSRRYEFFDSAKAKQELGFAPGPAREALRKAVAWYRANGYVKA
jgi:dihydroflavonol-4-reductase